MSTDRASSADFPNRLFAMPPPGWPSRMKDGRQALGMRRLSLIRLAGLSLLNLLHRSAFFDWNRQTHQESRR